MNINELETHLSLKGFQSVRLSSGRGGISLVAPGLQGRVLASWIDGELVSYININDLEDPEQDRPFNNYGGEDRFWIGPEVGEFGFFKDPGPPAEHAKQPWRVPRDLNKGAFVIKESTPSSLALARSIKLMNRRGAWFQMSVAREIRALDAAGAARLLGFEPDANIQYSAMQTINTVTNAGVAPWSIESGIPFIWNLGQFQVGDDVEIIAPHQGGELGVVYNAFYFGTIPDDRIKMDASKVTMRADGKFKSKIGMPPERTTGRAFALDRSRGLLYCIIFDVEPSAKYVNNLWSASAHSPFRGDAFQSYNSDDCTFFELESASPALELAPGQSHTHRHATIIMKGDPVRLMRYIQ
ncbi:MAG: hypothetical protein HY286_06385 [Planctomycetes bacterium]|nr:hypothetical protein [Planctomycetota bacterium]